MKLLKSFQYALEGIIFCLNNEKNFRIHTVIACYALGFSHFFGFSSCEYAVLFLTISLVIASEMVNTSIEKLCDVNSKDYSLAIKTVKDISAGAVFCSTVFSIAVGFCLFCKPTVLKNIFCFFIADVLHFALLVLSFAAAFFFVCTDSLRFKEYFLKFKGRYRCKKM